MDIPALCVADTNPPLAFLHSAAAYRREVAVRIGIARLVGDADCEAVDEHILDQYVGGEELAILCNLLRTRPLVDPGRNLTNEERRIRHVGIGGRGPRAGI